MEVLAGTLVIKPMSVVSCANGGRQPYSHLLADFAYGHRVRVTREVRGVVLLPGNLRRLQLRCYGFLVCSSRSEYSTPSEVWSIGWKRVVV